MPRTFAIGDIHGCSKTFSKLLFEEINIKKDDIIYCIGDYIDRGPNSRGVVDLILKLRKEGYTIHTLRGNHEEILLNSNNGPLQFDLWVKNGGLHTLESFGVFSVNELNSDYLNFFRQTQLYIATDKYIFVHAGLNFSIPNPLDDTIAMLWTRDNTVNEQWLGGRVIIHGHTPVPFYYIMAQPFSGSINIDNGCVQKNKPGMGKLIALYLEEKKIIAVDNID